MFGIVSIAMMGGTVARRIGGSGLMGAAAGVGISILLQTVAPKIAAAFSCEAARRVSKRCAARVADHEIQAASA